eukprot:12574226-Alexandrium_andersonii.AAC.1
MSASLVGSEMCIRDRVHGVRGAVAAAAAAAAAVRQPDRHREPARFGGVAARADAAAARRRGLRG